jgi:diketogulonate reductase-like aldo/keto reductase
MVRRLERLLKTANVVPAVNQVECVYLLCIASLFRISPTTDCTPTSRRTSSSRTAERKASLSLRMLPQAHFPSLCMLQLNLMINLTRIGYATVRGDPTIVSIANKNGVTPAQVILGWHFRRGVAVVPHSKNADRQMQNLTVSLPLRHRRL